MTALRVPIVAIVCVSTLVAPARTARAGVVEVAVQAAKSPAAKWFAGFAATYFVGKGADWTWDQMTGKPKIDALNRKISETEARYPAYKVYFEALRVNINANTDQLTFEHSIADIARKIDEDAAAVDRLKSKQAPALNFTPTPSLAATLPAGNGLSAPSLNLPTGSPFHSFASSGLGLSGVRTGSVSSGLVRARLLSPSDSTTGLMGKDLALPLANPIVSPYGDDSKLTPLNSLSTRFRADAMVMPSNPLHSPYGLGTPAAPANPGSSPSRSDLSVQPSNPVYPLHGYSVSTPPAPTIPLHSPYGNGTSVTPWRNLGYAPLRIDPKVLSPIPGFTLPGDSTPVTPSISGAAPPSGGAPVMPWDPRYNPSGLGPR